MFFVELYLQILTYFLYAIAGFTLTIIFNLFVKRAKELTFIVPLLLLISSFVFLVLGLTNLPDINHFYFETCLLFLSALIGSVTASFVFYFSN